jgi:hypothetical protein
MAPAVRSASSLSTLLFGLVYITALLVWNWVCSRHYTIQTREKRVPPRPRPLDAFTRMEKHKREGLRHATREGMGVTNAQRATRIEAAVTAAPTVATPNAAEAPSAKCPNRRPYHTLLTTQASTYQQWQSRIMYFHFRKQQQLDGPCTDMGGFTRLVASPKAQPDGLEDEMPSVFVKEYTHEEIAQYGHFGVLNRPYSVVQLVEAGGLTKIAEEYVYIAETDHVLMRPMPNLATADKGAAFSFGYMHASRAHQPVLDKHAPGVSYRQVQPIGPSPAMLHKATLAKLAPRWLQLSLQLKKDPDADRRFGWVLEMWGYSIAAAAMKVEHDVLRSFQVEGGAGISASHAKSAGTYIFHYTYGIEYTMGGRPQGPNQIGEWSLDKRHYGGAYPPRLLQPPPAGASDGALWLLEAWNEASANIANWPSTKALGTVGWRRVAGDGIERSALAKRVVGTRWKWAGIDGLVFGEGGKLQTPWGTGVWGVLPSGGKYNDDGFCASGCLFADFSSALHNVRFDLDATPATFKTYRLGDAANVDGLQVQ